MEELCFQLKDTHTKIQFLCRSISSITAPPGACAGWNLPLVERWGMSALMILWFRTVEMSQRLSKHWYQTVDFPKVQVTIELFTLPSGVCSGNPNRTHTLGSKVHLNNLIHACEHINLSILHLQGEPTTQCISGCGKHITQSRRSQKGLSNIC